MEGHRDRSSGLNLNLNLNRWGRALVLTLTTCFFEQRKVTALKEDDEEGNILCPTSTCLLDVRETINRCTWKFGHV